MKKLLLTAAILSLFSAASHDTELLQTLFKKFDTYIKSHPVVDVHVTFNQNKYATGDTAYFALNVYAPDYAPLRGKKIFGLSFVDNSGKLVQDIKFATFDGRAVNQLQIPQDASPGLYKCVVYAESSGAVLFNRDLIVVDKKIKRVRDSLTSKIAFYPEGGRFICGVKTKVALRSIYQGSHVVTSSDGQEIARVNVGQNGFAHFFFTPLCGASYQVEVEGQGIKIQMPNRFNQDGVGLSVNTSDSENIHVDVRVPPNSLLKQKTIYLVICNGRKIEYSKRIEISDSSTIKVNISRENLHDGLSQVTIFNEESTILSESVFYVSPPEMRVDLRADNNSYKQRENVVEEFSVTNKYGNPVSGNFSVSVFQKKLFEKDHFPFPDAFYMDQIPGFFLLSSKELTKEEWHVVMNDYLIFRNPRLVSWTDILNPQPSDQNHPIETNLKLKGRAIFGSEKNDVPDSTKIMTFLNNTMVGYETIAVKGNFDLTFAFDFYGDDELFYCMESKGKDLEADSLVVIENTRPHLPTEQTKYIKLDSIDPYADHQFKKRIMDRSYHFFTSEGKSSIKYLNPSDRFEEEMSGADVKINVQDFVVFHTMEDLVREVIPFLAIRKSKTQTRMWLLITYKDHNVKPKGEPLLIIDGVLTKNKEYFLNLKPIDILTIKLINSPDKLLQWGSLAKNGIVIVNTKKPVLASKIPSRRIKVRGLSKPIEFRNKSYLGEKSLTQRIPDFRSTLYWNPSVKVDADGKAKFSFFTSDLLGEYVVQVRGVTDKGVPFEVEKTLVVERK